MEGLIRKADARKAILETCPAAAHCLDGIDLVEVMEVVYGVWLDAGKNIYGQNLTRCNQCRANSIEGGRFCRCCGALMKQ